MQFKQSGTVYTQIRTELSTQRYTNASVSRHTPLLWTKTMSCITVDMISKYLNRRFFQ